MKLLLLIFAFGIMIQNCVAQENFKCACAQLGLDEQWTDSANIDCYLIPVEKDYKENSAGKYFMAVAKVPAINNTKEYPLLYLHGGPGIATLGNIKSYVQSSTWRLMRENHALIFFDYRGTGFSQPDLCNDLPDSLRVFTSKNPNPDAIRAAEVTLYQRCKERLIKQGIDLKSFSSAQLAADAEAIRKALNINQWNVCGVSYGTTIALNIIRNYPGSLSSVILDSPFPPNAPWVDFVRPFDTCFKLLENKLHQNPATATQFVNLRKDFATAIHRLNEKPALIQRAIMKDSTMSYPYRGDEFAWSIWSALLNPRSIPFVPLAIQEVANGNDSILQIWSTAFSSPDAFGKFSPTQSNAILCYEGKPQRPEDSEDSLRKKYPELSPFNSGFNAPVCNVWRPDNPDSGTFDPVVSDLPVLILAGAYDPVCPPFFGELTAKTLPNSTFLVIPAASHAAIHTDDCVRSYASDFLLKKNKKESADCIRNRKEIDFLTKDLKPALTKFKY